MIDEDKLKILGYNIQIARTDKKLTQEKLAELCNVSPNYISDIERGKSAGSISLIINICNCLNVTPNYIFNRVIECPEDSKNSIKLFPDEVTISYLNLQKENKKLVIDIIKHLSFMQKKR